MLYPMLLFIGYKMAKKGKYVVENQQMEKIRENIKRMDDPLAD